MEPTGCVTGSATRCVTSQVCDQLCNQLYRQVCNQVYNQVCHQGEGLGPMCDGNSTNPMGTLFLLHPLCCVLLFWVRMRLRMRMGLGAVPLQC